MEKSGRIDGIETKNIHKYMDNIRRGGAKDKRRDKNGDSGFDRELKGQQDEEKRREEERKKQPVVSQIIVNSREKVDRKIGLDIQKVEIKNLPRRKQTNDYDVGKSKKDNGGNLDKTR